MKLISKLLFPDSLPFQQRKQRQSLMVSVLVGLVFSTVFVIMAFKINQRGGW